MPVNAAILEKIQQKLAAYTHAYTLHGLLKQVAKGRIKQLVVDEQARPDWEVNEQGIACKTVTLEQDGQVIQLVIAKKNQGSQTTYSISLVDTTSHASVNNEVEIVFDQDGNFILNPGHDIPLIKEYGFSPRPLAIKTLQAFTQALLQHSESKQLGLLGTGAGKSIIIASAAEAVGSSVILLPSADLAKEMLGAFNKKVFAGKIHNTNHQLLIEDKEIQLPVYCGNGENTPPFVILATDIQDEAAFELLATRDDVHIILNKDHPQFENFICRVKNKLLLVDECHQLATNRVQAQHFATIYDQNVTFALTGTPTSHLISVFTDVPCIDFNLSSAIASGASRKLQARDISVPGQIEYLTEQALIAYFSFIFLGKGDIGYVDNHSLSLSQHWANCLKPCQRTMLFSDDLGLLNHVQQELTAIENGTMPLLKLEKYQQAVRKARFEQLIQHVQEINPAYAVQDLALEAALPVVDLQQDMAQAKMQAIKNTVLSFALSLLLKNEEQARFASLLRSNTLASYPWGKMVYQPLKDQHDLDTRLQALTYFNQLPSKEKDFIYHMIKHTTILLDEQINRLSHASSIPTEFSDITQFIEHDLARQLEEPITGLLAETQLPAATCVTMASSDRDTDLALLRYKVGLHTVAISDKRWSTGISFGGTLNTILIHSSFDFKDQDALCTPIGAAQAVGRAARDNDLRGSTTLIASNAIPPEWLFTTADILAPDSTVRTKEKLALLENLRIQDPSPQDESHRQAPEGNHVAALLPAIGLYAPAVPACARASVLVAETEKPRR